MAHYNEAYFRNFFRREAATTPFAVGTDTSITIRRSGFTLQLSICVISGFYHLDYRYGNQGISEVQGGTLVIDTRVTGSDNSQFLLTQAIEWVTKRNEDAGFPFPLDLSFGGSTTVFGDVMGTPLPVLLNPLEIVPAGTYPHDDRGQPILVSGSFYLSIGNAYPLLTQPFALNKVYVDGSGKAYVNDDSYYVNG